MDRVRNGRKQRAVCPRSATVGRGSFYQPWGGRPCTAVIPSPVISSREEHPHAHEQQDRRNNQDFESQAKRYLRNPQRVRIRPDEVVRPPRELAGESFPPRGRGEKQRTGTDSASRGTVAVDESHHCGSISGVGSDRDRLNHAVDGRPGDQGSYFRNREEYSEKEDQHRAGESQEDPDRFRSGQPETQHTEHEAKERHRCEQ